MPPSQAPSELATLNAAWIEAAARLGAPPASPTIRTWRAGRSASAQNGNSTIPIAAVNGLRAAKKKHPRDDDLGGHRHIDRGHQGSVGGPRAEQVTGRHPDPEQHEQRRDRRRGISGEVGHHRGDVAEGREQRPPDHRDPERQPDTAAGGKLRSPDAGARLPGGVGAVDGHDGQDGDRGQHLDDTDEHEHHAPARLLPDECRQGTPITWRSSIRRTRPPSRRCAAPGARDWPPPPRRRRNMHRGAARPGSGSRAAN